MTTAATPRGPTAISWERIATGLGDEYADTGGYAGALRRCQKGDAVVASL
jgi:hypothetical protein